MKLILIFTLGFIVSCRSFQLSQKRIINNERAAVTILSASVEGDDLGKSEGRYFSNKLSEFLLNDSLMINERSIVNAFEISMQLEGRSVYTPKELQKITSNFPSDYIILSRCKRLNSESIEVTVTVIDKSQTTRLIRSELISVPIKSMKLNEKLAQAAETLAYVL